MAEMTRRERILAASRRQNTDKVPFFHHWRHSQLGAAERECRNRGMGMCYQRAGFVTKFHDVGVTERLVNVKGTDVWRRTYSTPVGSIYLDERRERGSGQWNEQRGWRDLQPWQTERLIKGPEDYPVLKYVVEHTEYTPDYFPNEQAMDWLGEDGVCLFSLPHSSMQMLMIDWVGSEEGRFFIHHARYRDLVEDLYRAICKSREPLYEIAAKSPAEIIMFGDNLDGVLVNPRLFERYFLPEYETAGRIFHQHGKLMAVHMDGRLAALKELIARTPVDIVEAFHPPPMGDLPITEALPAWRDKSIWVGFPSSIYGLGTGTTRKFALNLLREIGSGGSVVIEMSSENIVSNENLLMLTSVLENASLPLTKDTIDQIEKSLQ